MRRLLPLLLLLSLLPLLPLLGCGPPKKGACVVKDLDKGVYWCEPESAGVDCLNQGEMFETTHHPTESCAAVGYGFLCSPEEMASSGRYDGYVPRRLSNAECNAYQRGEPPEDGEPPVVTDPPPVDDDPPEDDPPEDEPGSHAICDADLGWGICLFVEADDYPADWIETFRYLCEEEFGRSAKFLRGDVSDYCGNECLSSCYTEKAITGMRIEVAVMPGRACEPKEFQRRQRLCEEGLKGEFYKGRSISCEPSPQMCPNGW